MGQTLEDIKNETQRAREVILEDLRNAPEVSLDDLLRDHNGSGGTFSASVVTRAVLSLVRNGQAAFTNEYRVRLVQEDPEPAHAAVG